MSNADATNKLRSLYGRATQGPFVVRRHDQQNGFILYQVQQVHSDATSGRDRGAVVVATCADSDAPRARHDAELICEVLNQLPELIVDAEATRDRLKQ